MGSIIKQHGLENHCYANDMQLNFSCKPEAGPFIAFTYELSAWMKSSRLKLNYEKTDSIWITTAQCQRTFIISTVTVGGTYVCASVCPSCGARNLGVYFYSQLNLKQLISNVTKSCYFQLRQLCVVRRSLPSDVLWTLLQAFVTCRQDYCNSLLVGLLAQSSTICPECRWPSLLWCVQIWFSWACIANPTEN